MLKIPVASLFLSLEVTLETSSVHPGETESQDWKCLASLIGVRPRAVSNLSLYYFGLAAAHAGAALSLRFRRQVCPILAHPPWTYMFDWGFA